MRQAETFKSIVVAGYYGCDNVGDDAVLTSMLADLRAAFPDYAFTVAGLDAERLESRFGVRGVHLADSHNLRRAVAESRAVLMGGGGIFNDYMEYPDNLLLSQEPELISFGRIYGLPLLALMFRKPAMVFAAGASVIKSAFARRDIGLSVAVCQAATLRDAGSVEILRGLPLIDAAALRVTADPVFRLRGGLSLLGRRLLEGPEALPPPRLAVNLRRWDFHGDQRATEAAVAEAINAFFAGRDGSVLFLPFDSGAPEALDDDVSVLRRVAKRLKPGLRRELLTGYLEPGEALALIGGCDLALCMRLHPSVMAVKGAVPLVSLAYDQKVRHILAQAGLADYALDIYDIKAAELAARLEALWAGREGHRKILAAAAERQAAAAAENIDCLRELLARPYAPPPGSSAPEILDFFLNQARRAPEVQAEESLADFRLLTAEGHFKSCRAALDRRLGPAGSLRAPLAAAGEMHYLRAFCGQQLGLEPGPVLEDYDRALALGFSPFWVYYHRGQLYLSGGRSARGRDDLLRALALNPEHEGLNKLLRSGPPGGLY